MRARSARLRPAKQLELPIRGRGGWRPGAGRPRSFNSGVPHRSRERLAPRFPVHVTLRVRRDIPHLRRSRTFAALREAFRKGSDRFGFRLTQFTVQSNHLHLLCEAKESASLSRGMQGLTIRLAKRLNHQIGRAGRVFVDRYHSRILRTPREVRAALVYVLNNSRKHVPPLWQHAEMWVDHFSSAPFFDGWQEPIPLAFLRKMGAPAVAAAGTWLLRTGWRRYGLIQFAEAPRAAS